MKNWALAFALKHEGANVDSIYYTASYFENEGLTNPATAQKYTEKEIEDIRTSASEENENYIFNVREDALIGMKAFNTGKVFWFDTENGTRIVSYAVPLILNGETGTLTSGEGEIAAQPIE